MRIKNQNIYIWRLACVILSTLSITLFWENISLVSTLLVIFAILINIKASKAEIISYIVVSILATLLESLASFSGAWTYSYKHILTFPIWLPLYWGMGGIVMKDTYNLINEIIKK